MTKRSEASKIRRRTLASAKSVLQHLIEREFPFAVMHSCENIALFLRKPPEDGRPIEPEDVILPDGNSVNLFQEVNCWHCKEPLGHEDFAPDRIRRLQ